MVQYIIAVAERLLGPPAPSELREVFKLLQALAEELNRLDPRDFLPDAQFDFVLARCCAREWASRQPISWGTDGPPIYAMARKVIDVLGKYGGDGSRAVVRTFDFVKDRDLRRIIERDYRELRINIYPSSVWKSTVILAGSILEALLFDQLTTDPTIQTRAVGSSRAPKDRSGAVRDLAAGDWRLTDLIEVATDLSILPPARAKSLDQVLRDYRNFVHPKKEVRAQHQCSEAEAMMAVGALEGVCNILT